jgi:hypothetical protein
MVFLNILSASFAHLTASHFSVPAKLYFRAVSDRNVGVFARPASAFIICLASCAVGLMAVLYKDFHAFPIHFPATFTNAQITGTAPQTIAQVFTPSHGAFPLAKSNHNHCLAHVTAHPIIFCHKFHFVDAPVSHSMMLVQYFAAVGDVCATFSPRLDKSFVFVAAFSHCHKYHAQTLPAAIFITHLPTQNQSHSVFLPCAVMSSFVLLRRF